MRRLIPVVLILLALPVAADTFVITNVNVIPMTSNKVAARQTVIVRDGRIASVAKNAEVPAGAKIIDGQGKFLIPGLAEMHGHVPPMNSDMLYETLVEYV